MYPKNLVNTLHLSDTIECCMLSKCSTFNWFLKNDEMNNLDDVQGYYSLESLAVAGENAYQEECRCCPVRPDKFATEFHD